MLYGTAWAAMWGYRTVFTPQIVFAVAEAVNESPLFSGRGLITRDELVVVAQRSGTLNVLIAAGGRVQAGENILEIVDRDRLAEIERQINIEEQRIREGGPDAATALAEAERELGNAVGSLRALTVTYAELLRQGSSAKAEALFREIGKAAQKVDNLQREYQDTRISGEDFESRHEELLEQRDSAIYSLSSPIDGVIGWKVDGLSGRLGPISSPAERFASLCGLEADAVGVSSGDSVVAGQALCVIANPTGIILSIAVDIEAALPVEDFHLTINVNPADVRFLRTEEVPGEDLLLYVYEFTGLSLDAVNSRLVNVEIWPIRDPRVSIPTKALVSSSGGYSVYVVDEAGLVTEVSVSIEGGSGLNSVVTGLKPGQQIIATPQLVTPGEPVSVPGGG